MPLSLSFFSGSREKLFVMIRNIVCDHEREIPVRITTIVSHLNIVHCISVAVNPSST